MDTRVVIVDFNHMIHTYYHSQHRLSVTVGSGMNQIVKDTTIQNGCLKNIYRWSKGGRYPTACCFDRPVPARKAWFAKNFDMQVGTDKEYKSGRSRMPDAMYEGVSDCEMILREAGVSCFAKDNFESDDLIFACVERAKKQYPGVPIDIITNDADLLPLVDDIVSVFIRSKKGTYAERKDIEKLHYIQVTPENYEEVVENMSEYKKFYIPYNTILLHKMLRGDPSDNLGGSFKDVKGMFPPRIYNDMIISMVQNQEDISIFRYGNPTVEIRYKDTGELFKGTLQEALVSPDKDRLYQKIGDSGELKAILKLLDKYVYGDEFVLDHVRKMYWGMNLNQVYPNKNKLLQRRQFVVDSINPFNEVELQKAVSPLKIKLF